ncbi:50S ribosomal protein L11 methyltransferase [Acetobacterium tundrae]|uniref:Ribosomal protein L11 methyltransferase n=1 Tax=Acetobacterium tundrae TaxID=132932 RepID=A0ABR6WLU1_9FIRM|nr:50S ribosomal protein L11 methyltransferase [Acetobacterium tundrae]MBC3797407.1 50S ribosomal protein L11 methyltransferase [Acetobacterium tundrae]
MFWKEVQITTTLEAEEAVVNAFYEAGAQGVAIQTLQDVLLIQQDPKVNFVDESLLEMDPNVSIIRGYFSEVDDTEKALDQLIAAVKTLPACGLDPGDCELMITEIEEDDWANSWKKFYKPTKVGKSIVIKPTWEEYEPEKDEIVINIDPGMAFGTGTHETTQLCAIKLEEYIKPGDVVLDIGCGTGVLSLIAGKLKAKKVVAVDFDTLAVRIARENAELNDLGDMVEIREGNLLDVIDGEADVIVANILAAAIVELSGIIRPYLKENGIFISSGIIIDRLVDVLVALEAENFKILFVQQMGEWVGVVAQKRD